MCTLLVSLVCLQLLFASTHSQPQCPIAGCHPNRCYCINSFSALKKEPKVQHIQSPLQLSNRGCLANGNNIVCPLDQEVAVKEKAGCLTLSYDVDKNGSRWWKCVDIDNSIALPIIDINGDVIASDGYYLVDYMSNGSVVPKPVKLFPNTGQIVDMMFTNNSLFEMIYKCGLIVAYLPDGTAWASIWINNTKTTNGTFVPLSTPAISGERMYLLTGFWPTNASSIENDKSFIIRLYAIDSTRFMVGRLRIAWYHEVELEGYLPAIESHYKSCSYHPPSEETFNPQLDSNDNVAQVTVVGETVVFTLNYKTADENAAHFAVSIDDKNMSYHENCAASINKQVVVSLGSFQADDFDSKFKSDYIVKAIQSHEITKNSFSPTQLLIFDKLSVCKSPVKSIDLSSLLFDDKHQVSLTTDPLAIATMEKSLVYLAFGVMVATPSSTANCSNHNNPLTEGRGYIVALKISLQPSVEATVFWKEETPDGIPATGQVSVLGSSVVFCAGSRILLYGND